MRFLFDDWFHLPQNYLGIPSKDLALRLELTQFAGQATRAYAMERMMMTRLKVVSMASAERVNQTA